MNKTATLFRTGPSWCRFVLSVVLLTLTPSLHAFPCWTKFSKADFPHCQLLTASYSLHWRIASASITFGISLNATASWVGLGISEAGGMKGADILVVHQPSSGTWAVTDMFATDYAAPSPDSSQDASLLSVAATATSLLATLTRPLTTCDASDLAVLTNGLDQHIIWAHGTSSTLSYHGDTNRGNALVSFAPEKQTPATTDPSNTVPLSVVMPAFDVPSVNTTTYACTIVKVPTGPKRHLIHYESVVGSKLVHHMILYGCASAPAQPLNTTFSCPAMPTGCQTFYLGWVPGITEVSLPADAAFALGGSGINYLALQVHYNNPGLLTVPADSSGFTIHLTPTLRRYDVGVLTLGQQQLMIPPGNASFQAPPNLCPAACTSKFPTNLTVLSTTPHMHYIGKELTTRRIRAGVELSPLSQRKHWDFSYQQLIYPDPDDNIIMPGDQLITTCTYDSSDRTNVTQMGEDSQSEMCFNFITYYPAMPGIDICLGVGRNDSSYAACTTRSLFDQANPRNTTFLFTMLSEGKLVASTQSEFTPYQEACTPSNTTASSSPTMVTPATAGGSSPAPAAPKKGTVSNSGGSLLTQWGPAGLWRTAALASVLAVVFGRGLGMVCAF